ncbi:MAG: hypothetical protein ABSG63_14195 [Spirochaetia bacterium]|jgi:hypothetical protein
MVERRPNLADRIYGPGELDDYLKAHELDGRLQPGAGPNVDQVFKTSSGTYYLAEIGKLPRSMAIDPVTGTDAWVQQCPPGRMYFAGLEPQRSVRLFVLTRSGPRGQRAQRGAEVFPGLLWLLKTPGFCLVVKAYQLVAIETGATKVRDEEPWAVFSMLETPIDFSIPGNSLESFQRDGVSFRLLQAVKFVCPGSQLRRDARERAAFKKTGSMKPPNSDPDEWLHELEAGERAPDAPTRTAKAKRQAEVPVQSVDEIFAEAAEDFPLADVID